MNDKNNSEEKNIDHLKKVSAGILFIKNKKILLCHVTGKRHWDIPKGQPNENEDFYDAAIRECKEETGFEVAREDLHELGVVYYNNYKSLALFLYTGEEYPNENNCICTSYLDNGDPEVDDFEYFPLKTISEQTVNSLRKVIFNSLKDFYDESNLDKRDSKIIYKK